MNLEREKGEWRIRYENPGMPLGDWEQWQGVEKDPRGIDEFCDRCSRPFENHGGPLAVDRYRLCGFCMAVFRRRFMHGYNT